MEKVLLVLLVAVAFCVQAQEPFVIKGQLGAEKEGKVFLQYSLDDRSINDSAIIKKGVFLLRGQVNGTQRAWLSIHLSGDKSYSHSFYLEKGTVSVTAGDSLQKVIIKAGKMQNDYLALQTQEKPILVKMGEIAKRYQKKEFGREELLLRYDTLLNEIWMVKRAYIVAHPDSYLSFDLIKQQSGLINAYKYESLFDRLSERLRNSAAGKAFKKEMVIQKRTAIGQQAIYFTQNNPEGVPVTLASLKGKYVLLDFWASWCKPCREVNPGLVKIYNKFSGKNFEILAVSLDNNKERWVNAIKQDGLPWIHVSDLSGSKNAVSEAYGIRGIPNNFLIDPDGKILARNLDDKELEDALEKYLKH